MVENRCKCGSTTHLRTSFKDCPLNSKLSTAKIATSSPTTGDNAWEYHKEVDEYELEWESETVENLVTNRFKKCLQDMRAGCEAQKNLVRLPEELKQCGKLHFFLTSAEDLLQRLKGYMQKKAILNEIEEIQDWEFYLWVGMCIYCDQIPGELAYVFELLQFRLAKFMGMNFENCHVLTPARFQQIHQCVGIIDPRLANYRRDWDSVMDDVDNMRDFEKAIFKRSLEMCFSRWMYLVIDDGLVSCRSKSVQSGVLSERKHSRDGIKMDALAGSLTRIMYSIRHKQCINYSQMVQVQQLVMDFVGSRDVNDVVVAADRGYSNKKLWELLASVNLGFVMVTKKGPGAGHPFKSQSDLNTIVAKAAARKNSILQNTALSSDEVDLTTAQTRDEPRTSQENLDLQPPQQDELEASQENHDFQPTQQDENTAPHATPNSENLCGICHQICNATWEKKCLKCNRVVHNRCAQEVGLPETIIGCATCFVKTPRNPIWKLSDSTLLNSSGDVKNLRKEIRALIDKTRDIVNRKGKEVELEDEFEKVELEVEFEKMELEAEEPPPEDQKPCVPTGEVPKDIVDDSPLLGRQILVAERKYQTSRVGEQNTQKVWGIVFRDYNTAKNTETNVTRLTLSKPGKEMSYFAETLVMQKYNIPRGTDTSKVLFFPMKSIDKERKAVEIWLRTKSIPITCWQRSTDWFLARMFVVTATAGNKLANQDDEARKLLHKNPHLGLERLAEFGDVEAAAYLRQRWVFPREISTVDIKSGSMNEDSEVNALRKYAWCKEVYDCGLFISKQLEIMAVSPDGVAVVFHPNDVNQEVVASVDIKTRFADHTVNSVQACIEEYGNYFSCTVGDERWWKAIPSSNRARVLHQAAVLDLDYVLYCSATHTSLTMACLVKVTAEQRKIYTDSIKKWKHLMQFALDSLGTGGPPPKLHPAYSTEDSYILSSHFRVWRAFRKYQAIKGHPIHPVYNIKSAAQVLYNKLKGGVDGNTQFVSNLTGMAKTELPENLTKKLATRAIKQVLVNAFLMWRVSHVVGSDSFAQASLAQVSEKLNTYGSINMFAYNVGVEIARYAMMLKENPDTNASLVPLTVTKTNRGECAPSPNTVRRVVTQNKKHRNALLEQFNKGAHKKLRLNASNEVKHNPVCLGYTPIKNGVNKGSKRPIQRKCVVCKGYALYKCSDCDVVLHVTRRKGATQSSKTCWFEFHNTQTLQLN